MGDGTNFVIILAGALLSEAEDLIRMGLKPTEIADGYEMALEKALSVLETLSCAEIKVSLPTINSSSEASLTNESI